MVQCVRLQWGSILADGPHPLPGPCRDPFGLALDLLVTVPWDKIVLAAKGEEGHTDNVALLIGLLCLLRLVRCAASWLPVGSLLFLVCCSQGCSQG